MPVRPPSRRAMAFTAEADRVDDARRRLLADWCRLVGSRLRPDNVDDLVATADATTGRPRPGDATPRPAASPAPAPALSPEKPPVAGPAAAVVALGLPPRMAQILTGLLAGGSEKQIAAGLAISPHTVHTHVKLLHKRLNVASRGELLARFINPA